MRELYFVRYFLVLILSLCLAPLAARAEDTPVWLQKCLSLDKARKFDDAINILDSVVTQSPEDKRAYFYRGWIRMHKSDRFSDDPDEREAVESMILYDFAEAERLDPGFAPAYTEEAWIHYDASRFDTTRIERALAPALHSLALDTGPDDGQWKRYGIAIFTLGALHRETEALAIMDNWVLQAEVLADTSYLVRALNYRGEFYDRNLKNIDRAMENHQRLIGLDTNDRNAHEKLIELLRHAEGRDTMTALRAELSWICKIAEANPSRPQSPAKGEDLARLAVSLDSQSSQAWTASGLMAFHSDLYNRGNNRYGLAIERFTRALELDSRNAHALHLRATTYYFQDDFETAIADYEHAIEIDSSNVEVLKELAGRMRHLGRDTEAIIWWSRPIALETSAWDQTMRGVSYMRLGQFDSALEDFDEAARPGAHAWMPYIASCYAEKMGNREAAARYASVLVTSNEHGIRPHGLPYGLRRLAELARAQGDIPEALKYVAEAIRLDPRAIDTDILSFVLSEY